MNDNTNLDLDLIEYVNHSAEIKNGLIENAPIKYLIRAMFSGILLTFLYATYYSVDALFEGIGTETTNLGNIGAFLGGWIFAFALIFIYYTKSELLTSNMMVATVGKLSGKLTTKGFWKLLLYCFIGNALGGLFVSLILGNSTVITEQMSHLIQHSVDVKLGYVGNGVSGYLDLLTRAIWCNFFINLGMVPIYGGMVKSDSGKIAVIFGAIFIFMRLGFEHSVANTCLFTLAVVTGSATLSIGAVIPSIIVALIGNFIGGGLLVGGIYYYLNQSRSNTI